jgi:Protein of unknown function (DUF3119)
MATKPYPLVVNIVTTNPTLTATETIELTPSYKIPLVLLFAGLPLVLWHWWLGLPVALFGLFLTVQAVSLRLLFTATDLEVYRGETMIRTFPYSEWQNWEIFWAPVPILFYFKEVKSIHFLPIIFDPTMLRVCLEQRCPKVINE